MCSTSIDIDNIQYEIKNNLKGHEYELADLLRNAKKESSSTYYNNLQNEILTTTIYKILNLINIKLKSQLAGLTLEEFCKFPEKRSGNSYLEQILMKLQESSHEIQSHQLGNSFTIKFGTNGEYSITLSKAEINKYLYSDVLPGIVERGTWYTSSRTIEGITGIRYESQVAMMSYLQFKSLFVDTIKPLSTNGKISYKISNPSDKQLFYDMNEEYTIDMNGEIDAIDDTNIIRLYAALFEGKTIQICFEEMFTPETAIEFTRLGTMEDLDIEEQQEANIINIMLNRFYTTTGMPITYSGNLYLRMPYTDAGCFTELLLEYGKEENEDQWEVQAKLLNKYVNFKKLIERFSVNREMIRFFADNFDDNILLNNEGSVKLFIDFLNQGKIVITDDLLKLNILI